MSYSLRELRPRPGTDEQLNLLRAAWRHRWILLVAVVSGIGTALIYLQRATPVYASIGRLYVQRTLTPMGNDPFNMATQPQNVLYTQSEIIRSTEIVSEAARTHSLGDARAIQDHLKVEVDGRNDLISVTYECPDAAKAAKVVNAIIDQYAEFTSRRYRDDVAAAIRVLENNKADSERELRHKSDALHHFQQGHPALSLTSADRRTNLVVEKLSRLNDALTAARLASIDATAAYDTAVERSKLNIPAGSTVNDPLLRAEWIRLEVNREIISSRVGPNNQELQSADAAVARLQDQLSAQDKAVNDAAVASARRWRDAVRTKQTEIESEVAEQEKLAVSVTAAEAEFAALASNMQRDQKQSDSIDARIKELSVAATSPPTAVAVLEPARANLKPVSPEKSRVIAAGTLLGLLAGIIVAWGRTALTQSFGNSLDEIEIALGLPVLGTIPRSAEKDPAKLGQLTAVESHGAIAEAYRSICTTIVFGIPNEFKTLLIASPCSGDGKTTTAANLAIAMAQSGQKTLLIDADLRRPGVSGIFADRKNCGVTDVVSLRVKLRAAMQSSGVDSLFVLHAGAPTANPSELLRGRKFAELLAAVLPAFDKIVIDSPAIELTSDAQIIAAKVDATVLVVRSGRSTRTASQAAAASLASVGARVVGVIQNDEPNERKRNNYASSAFAPGNIDLDPREVQSSDIPHVAPQAGSSY